VDIISKTLVKIQNAAFEPRLVYTVPKDHSVPNTLSQMTHKHRIIELPDSQRGRGWRWLVAAYLSAVYPEVDFTREIYRQLPDNFKTTSKIYYIFLVLQVVTQLIPFERLSGNLNYPLREFGGSTPSLVFQKRVWESADLWDGREAHMIVVLQVDHCAKGPSREAKFVQNLLTVSLLRSKLLLWIRS
jgi:hypothetical protein